VLALLLVVALPLDGAISQVLRPFRFSAPVVFIDNTVRWLGKGELQLAVVVLLIALGAIASRRLLLASSKSLIAFAVAGTAVNVLKVVVHRTRPGEVVAAPAHWLGYIRLHDAQSFPSGDTATTFAIAFTLGTLFPRARLPLLLAAGAVGIERVLLLAHYPTDVIAGAALGIAVSRLVTRPPRVQWPRVRQALPFVLLGLYAAVVLLGGLGLLPLFGRDESLYGEAAREMLVSGDWVVPRVNGQPFLEKPPLYYWMAGAAFHVLRPSPLATRLPAALLGIVVVLFTACIGARTWGKRAGLLAGVALLTSFQFAINARMGIMDVPLTLFTMAALVLYVRWLRRGDLDNAFGFGLAVGLAVLLKATAGLIPVLVVVAHRVLRRGEERRRWLVPALLAAAVSVAVAAPWFITMAVKSEPFRQTFLHENLVRMVRPMQGHGGVGIGYFLLLPAYLPLILASFFPWSVFLPAALRRPRPDESEEARRWRGLALAWMVAVLVPFSLISTKLPGYVTPLFPAMALLVGAELDYRLAHFERASWPWVVVGSVLFAGFVLLLPRLAAALAGSVSATAQDVQRLVVPVLLWAATYGVIVLGGVLGRRGRTRWGLFALAIGQTAALGAAFLAFAPALDPHMEGAREYRAAQLARRAVPGGRVVLYETRPEAAAFVLGHTVPVFSGGQEGALVNELAKGRSALILPYRLRNSDFLSRLPIRQTWKVGDRALMELDPVRVLAQARP
jgi:4-amino-4-deoxy-L-arabinose transferase-like glycosyltransferase